MKLIKFKLNVIALLVTLISVLMTGCSDQYEAAKKEGIVFSPDGAFLIKCNNPYILKCVIPKGVIRIENYAFKNCDRLQSVKIPNSVTSIGRQAFMECRSLQSVTIPNSVTDIEYAAFSGCSSLQNVSIGNGVSDIITVFEYCYELKEVRVPRNCKYTSNAFPANCNVIRY